MLSDSKPTDACSHNDLIIQFCAEPSADNGGSGDKVEVKSFGYGPTHAGVGIPAESICLLAMMTYLRRWSGTSLAG